MIFKNKLIMVMCTYKNILIREKEKIMKILINGGCGFLGSNLASYGIQKGYDITVLII